MIVSKSDTLPDAATSTIVACIVSNTMDDNT